MTNAEREPKYIWKCKCEKFQVKVYAEPLFCMNCTCHCCVAAMRYIDENHNKDSTGTSAKTPDNNAACKVMLALKDIEFTAENPSDQLGYVKVGDKGVNIRSYTKCCGTQLNTSSGDFFPCNFRPFNRNALYSASDMTLWEPPSAAMYVNCKHAFVPMDEIPEPKSASATFGIMCNFIGGMIKKGMGIGANDALAGEKLLYAKGEDVDEVVPITWE